MQQDRNKKQNKLLYNYLITNYTKKERCPSLFFKFLLSPEK